MEVALHPPQPRQREQHFAVVAAGEVGASAGGAEQGVAGKNHIVYHQTDRALGVARRVHYADSQLAQRQCIALVIVALVLFVHTLEHQVVTLPVGGVGPVDIDGHIVLFQQGTHGAAMVEMAVSQQDILQGTTGVVHHRLHLFGVIARVDQRADSGFFILQQIAVGHNGTDHHGINFHIALLTVDRCQRPASAGRH